jgi:hypothetical protein
MKKIYFSIFLVYINFLVAISQTTPAPKQQGEIAIITGGYDSCGQWASDFQWYSCFHQW